MQTLDMAAQLRLPPSMSAEQRTAYVDRLVATLGLAKVWKGGVDWVSPGYGPDIACYTSPELKGHRSIDPHGWHYVALCACSCLCRCLYPLGWGAYHGVATTPAK